MMYRYCFLLLLVCSVVLCRDCVTEDFENGFGSNFTNTVERCIGHPMWNIQQYSSLNMKSPHPRSTRFITPQKNLWTCMASFKFTVAGSGALEVNRYALSQNASDSVFAAVYQYVVGGNDLHIGTWLVWSNGMVPGWQTLRFLIPRSNGFVEGYVVFSGTVSSTSTVLIDSFRYISPSFDEDLCVIYKDEQTTTTIKAPTTTIPTELPTTTTTTTELFTTKPTTTEVPTIQSTMEVPISTTNVPSTTAAIITTVESTTTTAATKPTSTTVTAPSTSTGTPRLSITVQKIYKELNAKILKYFR